MLPKRSARARVFGSAYLPSSLPTLVPVRTSQQAGQLHSGGSEEPAQPGWQPPDRPQGWTRDVLRLQAQTLSYLARHEVRPFRALEGEWLGPPTSPVYASSCGCHARVGLRSGRARDSFWTKARRPEGEHASAECSTTVTQIGVGRQSLPRLAGSRVAAEVLPAKLESPCRARESFAL